MSKILNKHGIEAVPANEHFKSPGLEITYLFKRKDKFLKNKKGQFALAVGWISRASFDSWDFNNCIETDDLPTLEDLDVKV